MNKPVKVKGFVAVDSCGDKTDALVKKFCEWLETNYTEFLDSSRLGINIEELVKALKNDFKTE